MPVYNGVDQLLKGMVKESQDAPQRIKWTSEEIDALAHSFLDSFLDHPFKPVSSLFDEAQTRTLPSHRIRKLNGISSSHELQTKIGELWKEFRSKATATQETAAPIIITVEKEAPISFKEIIDRADVATLVAALIYKMNADTVREIAKAQQSLQAIAKRLGEREPIVKEEQLPLPPKSILIQETKKVLPRVALVGPLKSQFTDISVELEKAKLPVEIKFVDKDKNTRELGVSCDYCIVTKHSSHAWFDSARSQLESNRVFFVDGGIEKVIQKLRDIASRQ